MMKLTLVPKMFWEQVSLQITRSDSQITLVKREFVFRSSDSIG